MYTSDYVNNTTRHLFSHILTNSNMRGDYKFKLSMACYITNVHNPLYI
ncbi:PPC domain-containing protein [Psidium guajava]|nr:PPC domain-containing protein [Psidium guajava]